MSVSEFVVSSSGQMSLPAEVRRRWGLTDGGPVDVLDLGFGVLTVPKGTGRALLSELLPRSEHADFVSTVSDDEDLATTWALLWSTTIYFVMCCQETGLPS